MIFPAGAYTATLRLYPAMVCLVLAGVFHHPYHAVSESRFKSMYFAGVKYSKLPLERVKEVVAYHVAEHDPEHPEKETRPDLGSKVSASSPDAWTCLPQNRTKVLAWIDNWSQKRGPQKDSSKLGLADASNDTAGQRGGVQGAGPLCVHPRQQGLPVRHHRHRPGQAAANTRRGTGPGPHPGVPGLPRRGSQGMHHNCSTPTDTGV